MNIDMPRLMEFLATMATDIGEAKAASMRSADSAVQLTTTMAELKTEVTVIKGELHAVQGELHAIQGEVGTFGGRIEALEGSLHETSRSIELHNTRMEGAVINAVSATSSLIDSQLGPAAASPPPSNIVFLGIEKALKLLAQVVMAVRVSSVKKYPVIYY